jgi:all-trans-retinol 13,14-reductase
MATATDVDVIVIGSGAGGLSAALALAQSGLSVRVLEQHYLPGGWCHSFPLGGYRFSPGVHYVGELHPGGLMRRIYEGLGVANDMTFLELSPDGIDHVRVGNERFDIPRGRDVLAERLARRFPAERRGIERYLHTIECIGFEMDHEMDARSWRERITLPFRASHVSRWALRSAQSMIDTHVRDPLLRAILAAQAGDHGMAPSRAPGVLHAAVTKHYLNGGYYPRGGGSAIPLAFLRALKRAHATVRLEAPVSRILVENGRAVGIAHPDGTQLRAKHVVSNADPGVTYGTLVGAAHLSRGLRRKLAATTYSTSAVSLFLATDLDLASMGFDSGNYWCYAHDDVDAIYRREAEDWTDDGAEVPGLFVTFTTLKDRSKERGGHHTIEAFAFVGYDPFRRWGASVLGERPPGYVAMKERLRQRMIDAVARLVPGLREHVLFAEIGTPLTNQHYVAATHGGLYGTEKRLGQVGPWAFGTRTEIPGLHLCGSSTLSHGVLGATLSGLAVASDILRCEMPDLLTARGQTLRIYPADEPSTWPEAMQRRVHRDERTTSKLEVA